MAVAISLILVCGALWNARGSFVSFKLSCVANAGYTVGSILLAFLAILVSLAMLWRSDKKHAAVGRRYAFTPLILRIGVNSIRARGLVY